MKSTSVNVKINIPQDKWFIKELVSHIMECTETSYNKKNDGWYYVDIDVWFIHWEEEGENTPSYWIPIEKFAQKWIFETDPCIGVMLAYLQEELNIDIYENWSQTKDNTESLGKDWQQDPLIQKEILEYYKKVCNVDGELLKKNTQKVKSDIIKMNLHEQIDLEIEACLVFSDDCVLNGLELSDRVNIS